MLVLVVGCIAGAALYVFSHGPDPTPEGAIGILRLNGAVRVYSCLGGGVGEAQFSEIRENGGRMWRVRFTGPQGAPDSAAVFEPGGRYQVSGLVGSQEGAIRLDDLRDEDKVATLDVALEFDPSRTLEGTGVDRLGRKITAAEISRRYPDCDLR